MHYYISPCTSALIFIIPFARQIRDNAKVLVRVTHSRARAVITVSREFASRLLGSPSASNGRIPDSSVAEERGRYSRPMCHFAPFSIIRTFRSRARALPYIRSEGISRFIIRTVEKRRPIRVSLARARRYFALGARNRGFPSVTGRATTVVSVPVSINSLGRKK